MIIEHTMGDKRVVDIENAVSGSMDGGGYGVGSAEAVQSTVENLCNAFGKLAAKLHDKGVLDDADIVDMLSWRFTARPR